MDHTNGDGSPTQNNFPVSDYDLQLPAWSLESLKTAAIQLRLQRPRSLAWAILLNTLPPPNADIVGSLKIHRNFYNDLKAKLSMDPRTVIGDDPLSQNDESAWNQHFCDNELKALILQDVVRTFPDELYFRDKGVQDMMVQVLFFWARSHAHVGYRQGMHEVLAPLLSELHKDRTHAPRDISNTLKYILEEEYLEHDSYMLFNAVLRGLERFYTTGDVVPGACGRLPVSRRVHNPNEVVRYLDKVRVECLTPFDNELATHLVQCNISMELFGIRWLRLLFGREFPRAELPALWGFLFAEGPQLPHVRYLVVALLVAMRPTREYHVCRSRWPRLLFGREFPRAELPALWGFLFAEGPQLPHVRYLVVALLVAMRPTREYHVCRSRWPRLLFGREFPRAELPALWGFLFAEGPQLPHVRYLVVALLVAMRPTREYHVCRSRWLRLLFGREFPRAELPALWGFLFAEGPQLPHVRYLVVALLVAMRPTREYHVCRSRWPRLLFGREFPRAELPALWGFLFAEGPQLPHVRYLVVALLVAMRPTREYHVCRSRWLRLLFGREFPRAELPALWGFLFAEGPQLPQVRYLVVALLVAMRPTREYHVCRSRWPRLLFGREFPRAELPALWGFLFAEGPQLPHVRYLVVALLVAMRPTREYHVCRSRWLRLLFGREFPRAELPALWGFLFAEGPQLPHVRYLVVALLVAMRPTREYHVCRSRWPRLLFGREFPRAELPALWGFLFAEGPQLPHVRYLVVALLVAMRPTREYHVCRSRWPRLLFGREFPRAELPALWGFLFAEGPQLPHVRYLVVALLVAMRPTLMSAEPGEVLAALMRPPRVPAAYACGLALHLRSPLRHPKPTPPARTDQLDPSSEWALEQQGFASPGSDSGSSGVAEGADIARSLAALGLLRAQLPPAAAALARELRDPPPRVARPLQEILKLAALLECRNHALIDVETALEAAEPTITADKVGRRQLVPVIVKHKPQPKTVAKAKEVPLKLFYKTECFNSDLPCLDPLRLRTE